LEGTVSPTGGYCAEGTASQVLNDEWAVYWGIMPGFDLCLEPGGEGTDDDEDHTVTSCPRDLTGIVGFRMTVTGSLPATELRLIFSEQGRDESAYIVVTELDESNEYYFADAEVGYMTDPPPIDVTNINGLWLHVTTTPENTTPFDFCVENIEPILSNPNPPSCVVYVDGDRGNYGGHDGASWANAFEHVQEGIDAAETLAADGTGTCEVWVADGTYLPTVRSDEADDRTYTIQLKPGVSLYGGFEGGEAARDDRDFENHETILSGDIGMAEDNADNAYHVVTGADDAVIDGFTITAGNSDGSSPHNRGGGMYNRYFSPTVTNCTFSNNSASGGGGMYNDNSLPTVTDCTFSNNSAELGGGGMVNYNSSSPTVTNCTFFNNSSESFGGGGMYNYDNSSPTVTNCTFSGNSADLGVGMRNKYYSSPTVTDCILWGDEAEEISNYDDGTSSPVVTYSDVQGGYEGTGNIDADPLFVSGTLRLDTGSPCINTGNDEALPADVADLDGDGDTVEPTPLDLDLNPRVVGNEVDMGAYERQ
jgi:parallel beta-helix repeat protein